MNHNIDFSVVIPTCDRPQLLRQAVESVLSQSLPPREIIVVDNGVSPVETLSLPNNPIINLIRALPRFGVSQARNLGAILSTGEYVAFLDDDDTWDVDYLKGVRNCLGNNRVSIVLGRRRYMESKAPRPGKQVEFSTPYELINMMMIRNPGVSGSNTVVLRSVFALSRGYDPYLTTGQDKALVLDLLLKGESVARAEAAWVDYRDDRSIPRQTELAKLIEGKSRFAAKYWGQMSLQQKIVNLRTLSKMRLRLIMQKLELKPGKRSEF